MKTEILPIDPLRPQPEKIKYAASALKKGKLVVFPTETVYGIGADAQNKKALVRLRKLKERPGGPFSFHIASKQDLKKLNCAVSRDAKKLIDKFWPGPLTLVLPVKSGGNIGVRMPAHKVAFELLKSAGAGIVAPSANFKSQEPATTAEAAFNDLNGLVDIIIDSGPAKIGVSSTVLDLTQGPPRILREGSVSRKSIGKLLGRQAR